MNNAPAYFVGLMNWVFLKQLNKFMLVIIDDILVYFRTEKDHKG